MACLPTPTETRYATIVSTVSSTALSDDVLSTPPLLATVTTFSCLPTVRPGNDTSCVSVVVPVVTTISVGGVQTVQVPIFTIVSVTHTIPTTTLFASCQNEQTTLPVDPPPPPSPAPSDLPSAPSVPSTHSSILSPSSSPSAPPGDATAAAAPTSAGAIVVSLPATTHYVTTITTTSTEGLASSQTSSSAGSSSTTAQADNGGSSGGGGIIAPIVGGILGGFFGLIGIVILIWFCWRKRGFILDRSRTPSPLPELPSIGLGHGRSRSRKRTQAPAASGTGAPEPKPYQYGAVGSATSRRGVVASSHSQPGTPRQSSSLYSHSASVPPSTPNSFSGNNRASSRLSMAFSQFGGGGGGAYTPPMVPSTALAPGQSQPSTRPPTPGHFSAYSGGQGHSPSPSQSAPPSAFNFNVRQSWPLMGTGSDEGHEPSLSFSGSDVQSGSPTQMRSRRPSRLSLAMSGWETELEQEQEARSSRAVSSRSVSMSVMSMSMSMQGELGRPPTAMAGEEPRDLRDERQRSTTLFVVNADAPGPMADAPPPPP